MLSTKNLNANDHFIISSSFNLDNVVDLLRDCLYWRRKLSIRRCDALNSYKDISDCDAIVMAKA